MAWAASPSRAIRPTAQGGQRFDQPDGLGDVHAGGSVAAEQRADGGVPVGCGPGNAAMAAAAGSVGERRR